MFFLLEIKTNTLSRWLDLALCWQMKGTANKHLLSFSLSLAVYLLVINKVMGENFPFLLSPLGRLIFLQSRLNVDPSRQRQKKPPVTEEEPVLSDLSNAFDCLFISFLVIGEDPGVQHRLLRIMINRIRTLRKWGSALSLPLFRQFFVMFLISLRRATLPVHWQQWFRMRKKIYVCSKGESRRQWEAEKEEKTKRTNEQPKERTRKIRLGLRLI